MQLPQNKEIGSSFTPGFANNPATSLPPPSPQHLTANAGSFVTASSDAASQTATVSCTSAAGPQKQHSALDSNAGATASGIKSDHTSNTLKARNSSFGMEESLPGSVPPRSSSAVAATSTTSPMWTERDAGAHVTPVNRSRDGGGSSMPPQVRPAYPSSFRGADSLPRPAGPPPSHIRHKRRSRTLQEVPSLFTDASRIAWARDLLPDDRGSTDSFFDTVSYAIMGLGCYAALLCTFDGAFFVPYDAGFAILLLWSCAMAAGPIAKRFQLPPFLGMLVAGILLRNIGDPIRGLNIAGRSALRNGGFMLFLLQTGLELDFTAATKVGGGALRLAFLPTLIEASVGMALGVLLFDVPFFNAVHLGFILAASSPIVTAGSMQLHAKGLGTVQGFPAVLTAAVPISNTFAIAAAAASGGWTAVHTFSVIEAFHGPISIVGGVTGGIVGAVILSMTRLWRTHRKRSIAVMLCGTIALFGASGLGLLLGGSITCLVLAVVTSLLWDSGWGQPLADGPLRDGAAYLQQDLALLWRVVAEPLLFSSVGSEFDLSLIDLEMFLKASTLALCCMFTRAICTYLALLRTGLTARERLAATLAWGAKCVVQGVLGTAPLHIVWMDEDHGVPLDGQHQHRRLTSQSFATTVIMSILVTVPISLFSLQWLCPRWLQAGQESKILRARTSRSVSLEEDKLGLCSAYYPALSSSVVPGDPTASPLKD